MLSWEPGSRGSQPLFFKSILVSACLLCYTEYSDSTQFDTIRHNSPFPVFHAGPAGIFPPG